MRPLLQPKSRASRVPADRPSTGHPRGIAGFLLSFTYAWSGVVYTMRTQRNARVHVCVAVLVVLASLLLRLHPWEVALLLGMVALVIACEMLNTVVEAIVDLVTAERHPLAKIAKDVAAGSVLVAAIGAACVGLLVLGPPLVALVFH